MEGVDLSLAQVEAELRAAEAYLTSGEASGDASSPYEQMRTPHADSDSPFFKRPARTRPAISDDRRKEILAKLSTERQAAIRRSPKKRQPNESHEDGCVLRFARSEASEGRGDDSSSGDKECVGLDQTHYYGRADDRWAGGNDESEEEYDEDEGDVEVFYASDVIGRPVDEEIKPRTALDLFASDDEPAGRSDDVDELADTQPTNYRRAAQTPDQKGKDEVSGSLLAKVFGRRNDWYNDADMYISKLLENDSPTISNAGVPSQRIIGHPLDGRLCESPCSNGDLPSRQLHEGDKEHDMLQSTGDTIGCHQQIIRQSEPQSKAATSSRIDKLAQPRTHIFAEREKQRLVREMEELKECTFRPAVLRRPASFRVTDSVEKQRHPKKATKSVHFDARRRSAGNAFPWLTLSPRQRKQSGASPFCRSRSLIDRLNLDVTAKYEARERLRQILEAEEMRECTFQPKINSLSQYLLSRTDYRPIHQRVGEIQREKIEYVQRKREELASEDGAHTFKPHINPRSREIAKAVLREKQISKIRARATEMNLDDENGAHVMIQPPRVTERLNNDAEKLAEKRMAVQEYYDALEEKPFAPKISETSNRLVGHRPEFKLDFLSRQQYFQMFEQEKLEALEDHVQQEQQITFRPNIGNADKLLREMRPDLANESTHQRLHRLIYHEPRRSELYRQRLREEANKELTFKPEINSVSKALADKAKAEVAKRATRRHELQRYFAGKQFRSRVARELDQAEKAECTFHPQLNSRPKVKSSSTSKLLVKDRQQNGKSLWHSDNILHSIEVQRQQRADELQARRNALELRELENCTFQPNLRRPRRRALSDGGRSEEKPVIVRGLGRFLELKERAKRQQEEQRQREEKVFNPNYSYEPRSYTIPKPFKLSQASKDSIRRRLKVREELRSKERTECTFTPQTLEAQQRQALRVLLHE